MADLALPNKADILQGFPLRRAKMSLYTIEARTAQLAQQNRRSTWRFALNDPSQPHDDYDLFEALSGQREQPQKIITVRQLERYAPQWASLVPEDPKLRTALAWAMSEKYALSPTHTPQINQALGLDTAAVRQASHTQFGKPIEEAYSGALPISQKAGWGLHRLTQSLENLPPFWAAFAMILTETVGGGILALPIALAQIGALGGLIVIVVLGIINIFTIACVAEAIIRNGSVRYRGVYFGRVVEEYLGRAASVVFTVAVAAVFSVVMFCFNLGLSGILANVTHIPKLIWLVVIFLVCLFFLTRGSLNTTIGAALLIGFINLFLILLLTGVALSRFNMDFLSYSNIDLGNTGIFQLIFGVVLLSYWGHTSVATVANVTLKRDPSGKSLLWGAIAAEAAAIVIYAVWAMAFMGAINPVQLATETGTVLTPLSAEVGTIVDMIGLVFSILSMGLIQIYMAIGLFSLVKERLPQNAEYPLRMLARQAVLELSPRQKQAKRLHIGIVYLGMARGFPQFRFDVQYGDKIYHQETPITGHWDAIPFLQNMLGEPVPIRELILHINTANMEQAKLVLHTSLRFQVRLVWDALGLRAADVLAMPDDYRTIVNWMTRQRHFSAAELAEFLERDTAYAQALIEEMLIDGTIRTGEAEGSYQARIAAKQGSTLNKQFWISLSDTQESTFQLQLNPKNTQARSRNTLQEQWIRFVTHRYGGFLVALSPVIVIFLLTAYSLITGSDNFTKPLGYIGTLGATLVLGIFSLLMLVASRQRGELIPQRVIHALGNRLLLGILYSFFVIGIFLYGFIIWKAPLAQIAAIAVGVLTLYLSYRIAFTWRGFSPRAIVEVRLEQDEYLIEMIYAGALLPIEAEFRYADERIEKRSGEKLRFHRAEAENLQSISLGLPHAQDVKLLTYHIQDDGVSHPLPIVAELEHPERPRTFDMRLLNGEVITRLQLQSTHLELHFAS